MKSPAITRPALLRSVAALCLATAGTAGAAWGQGYPVSSAPVGGRGVAKVPGTSGDAEPEKPQGLITSAETFDLAPGETIVEHDPLPEAAESHAPHGPAHQHTGFARSHSASVPCDPGCDRAWYGLAEALYYQRDGDEAFTLNNAFPLGEFDHEWGGRLTFGRMLDCVEAVELVVAGRLDWTRFAETEDLGDGLFLNLAPEAPLVVGDLDAFYGAREQVQRYDASLDSFELNRRSHGWDVVSTLYGLRVINYDEDYRFFSEQVNPAPAQGLLREHVENLLVGGQIGGDLLYPFGERLFLGMRGRLGLFVNFAESTTVLNHDGTILVDNHAEDEEIAFSGEYGIFASYFLGRSLRVRAGYDIWYMGGMATVPEQFTGTLGFGTGRSVRADDSVVVHGGTVGVELVY